MIIEFTVTADLETGEFNVTCQDMFQVTNKGWGPEVKTNYSETYKDELEFRVSNVIRTRFMKIAQLTKAELKKSEVQP